MPSITNPTDIPAAKRPAVKAVCEAIGPQLLGDKYPTDNDGNPVASLSAAQAGQVFEHITREFWRQQIEAYEANKAAEEARKTAIAANTTDPFDD